MTHPPPLKADQLVPWWLHWTLRCRAARLCWGLDRKCTFAFHSRRAEPPTASLVHSACVPVLTVGSQKRRWQRKRPPRPAPEAGQLLGEQREHHDRAPGVPGWGWTCPVNGILDVASISDPSRQSHRHRQRTRCLLAHTLYSYHHNLRQKAGCRARQGQGAAQTPGQRWEEAEGPTDKKQKAGGPQGDHRLSRK